MRHTLAIFIKQEQTIELYIQVSIIILWACLYIYMTLPPSQQ
jgi:hypothetical protein